MRLSGIIIFSALFAASLFAKDPKVRQAWVKTYSQKALRITSDNIGHVVVFGSEVDESGTPTNSSPIFLLNSHGRRLASVAVPFTNGVSVDVKADKAGRIFTSPFSWRTSQVQCAAFSARLSKLLWSKDRIVSVPNGTEAYPVSASVQQLIPDETGGAHLFGACSLAGNPGFFVAPFDAADAKPTAFWFPLRDGYWRSVGNFVRSPNGTFYGIGEVSVLYVSAPILLTYVSGEPRFGISEQRPGPPSSRWYNTVTCDSDTNLVFGGGYKNEAFYRSVSQCLIEKRSPDLGYTWSVTHESGYFANVHSVAVDRQKNVIVLCSHGLTKYTPDGQMLRQTSENGLTFRVNRRGNIFLLQEISDESGIETPLITKLGPDGERVWQIQPSDGEATESSYASGLVCDDKGGICVAVQSSQATKIMRYVERGPNRDR